MQVGIWTELKFPIKDTKYVMSEERSLSCIGSVV